MGFASVVSMVKLEGDNNQGVQAPSHHLDFYKSYRGILTKRSEFFDKSQNKTLAQRSIELEGTILES